jgi:hypothetical protein
LTSAEPRGCRNQAAGCVSPGKGQDPLPGWNVNPGLNPQIVEIDNPLVPKTDTQETGNLDKAISLDQEGASLCSLLLSKHASTKWLTVGPPYFPDAVVPAPHLGFVQVRGSQSFPGWLKGLGDGLGHAVWQAMELYRNPEEEARSL